MVVFMSFVYAPFLNSFQTTSEGISEHQSTASINTVMSYWTPTHMLQASNLDQPVQTGSTANGTQENSVPGAGKAVKQQGVAPRDKSVHYPLSTVGKIFFTTASGRDSMCSGTAVKSDNQSTVDTAGHCLYYYGGWATNVIFCPLYNSGSTPYGCWAARDLEVPSDWMDNATNFHHDFGEAIVAPNSEGKLTDVVGGAGWAYNQPVNQPFYAYGYPAGYPFDGQTRQSCESPSSTLWQLAKGNVISIPCNMTGGSSGGPWFIQINGNLYLDGHNDFTSSMKIGHMFSPYYETTWYDLYQKAQNS
jgi:V8-like Glu-specific endopeptidase